jgi:DNA-binding response OmpR family regulator
VKPFDLEELLLRIENILRRKGERRESSPKNDALSGIILDMSAKRVTRSHIPVDLSPKEYALFEILFKNRGRVLDRDFLYETVW